jgi:hypothetical protein
MQNANHRPRTAGSFLSRILRQTPEIRLLAQNLQATDNLPSRRRSVSQTWPCSFVQRERATTTTYPTSLQVLVSEECRYDRTHRPLPLHTKDMCDTFAISQASISTVQSNNPMRSRRERECRDFSKQIHSFTMERFIDLLLASQPNRPSCSDD